MTTFCLTVLFILIILLGGGGGGGGGGGFVYAGGDHHQQATNNNNNNNNNVKVKNNNGNVAVPKDDNIASCVVEHSLDKQQHVFPQGPWISSAKDIHIEPISSLVLLDEEENDEETIGAVRIHAANNRSRKDNDGLWRLRAKLRTKWRGSWRQAETIFQVGDCFMNQGDGQFVRIPSGSWTETARLISSEPLNEDRSLWLLKAKLLSADGCRWTDSVTIFQQGDEFVNDDGTFVRCVVKQRQLFKKWQITKHQPNNKMVWGMDTIDLSLNLWEILLLFLPPFSLLWGDSIKKRFLYSQCKLESTQIELRHTIQALQQVMITHENELVTLQLKLDQMEKEKGKLQRVHRKATTRQVSKTLVKQKERQQLQYFSSSIGRVLDVVQRTRRHRY